MNVQVLSDPAGRLVRASPALPGSVHDLTAARTHHLIDTLTSHNVMTLADKGCQTAGGTVFTPFTRQPRRPPLSCRQKAVNRSHARVRGIGERAVSTLKTWKVLAKPRCCPAAPPRSCRPSSFSTTSKTPPHRIKKVHSRKRISEVEVGDEVFATDPETGEEGPRTVTHLWVHEDTLVDLEVEGGVLETTEDHPFWNATDRQWQRADALDPGDHVRASTGRLLPVEGLADGTRHDAAAYNLTVTDIHTYYVLAGSTPVLVHNDNPGGMVGPNGTQITSSTVWLRGPYRIDVENPNPGVRPGQMHFQDQATGAKYLYNHDTGKFDGMPNSLQKELDKKMPDYKKAIAKGNRFLGMSGC